MIWFIFLLMIAMIPFASSPELRSRVPFWLGKTLGFGIRNLKKASSSSAGKALKTKLSDAKDKIPEEHRKTINQLADRTKQELPEVKKIILHRNVRKVAGLLILSLLGFLILRGVSGLYTLHMENHEREKELLIIEKKRKKQEDDERQIEIIKEGIQRAFQD